MAGNSGPVTAVDVEAVAQRTERCRSVARISTGPFGEVATYFAGGRVPGVRIRDGRLEIHVVACWGAEVPELAGEVRKAVRPVAGELPIDVHIDDLDVPDDADGAQIYLPDTD
jgi:hypothetical protein